MQRIDHIGPLLRMIHTAIDRQLSNRAQEMDLTGAQLFVLHYINRNSDRNVFQKDIEERFELSHATVSGLIARLETKGFLECVPSEADKRFKKLCVTEKARQCDEQMHIDIEKTEQQLLDGFSDDDILQLRQYLDRILQNLGIDFVDEKKQKGDQE